MIELCKKGASFQPVGCWVVLHKTKILLVEASCDKRSYLQKCTSKCYVRRQAICSQIFPAISNLCLSHENCSKIHAGLLLYKLLHIHRGNSVRLKD